MAAVITTAASRDRLRHWLLRVVLEVSRAHRDQSARQCTENVTICRMDVARVFIVGLRGVVILGKALVDGKFAALSIAHE